MQESYEYQFRNLRDWESKPLYHIVADTYFYFFVASYALHLKAK